jgi:RNA polymerase sigma-70 factor (ECF subfamily)
VTTRAETHIARLVEQARASGASLDARQRAFTVLVEHSQHVVFAVSLASLRNVEDARDVAQDAFATAWRRLRQLRDPVAFSSWMHAIVRRECARRRRLAPSPVDDQRVPPRAVEPDVGRVDYQPILAAALDQLSAAERDVTLLHYFLGYTPSQIARLLRLKPGTVRKRLHSARLRIRRVLPRSVRHEFVRASPSRSFAERVRRGLLDEYVGDYRFDRRPDHVVSIRRLGDTLVGESGGQRHVLVSDDGQRLLTYHYDGEGDFRRNRRGEITHFVYYEFGRRLGIARKVRR